MMYNKNKMKRARILGKRQECQFFFKKEIPIYNAIKDITSEKECSIYKNILQNNCVFQWVLATFFQCSVMFVAHRAGRFLCK